VEAEKGSTVRLPTFVIEPFYTLEGKGEGR
jgi:hypothetical protein